MLLVGELVTVSATLKLPHVKCVRYMIVHIQKHRNECFLYAQLIGVPSLIILNTESCRSVVLLVSLLDISYEYLKSDKLRENTQVEITVHECTSFKNINKK